MAISGGEVNLLEEVKALQKGITDILVAIGKIETEIKQLSNIAAKQADTERTVILLEQSVKTAHEDIEDLREQVTALERKMVDKERAGKEDKKWLWGFLVGAAALVLNFMKSIGGNGG